MILKEWPEYEKEKQNDWKTACQRKGMSERCVVAKMVGGKRAR